MHKSKFSNKFFLCRTVEKKKLKIMTSIILNIDYFHSVRAWIR